MQPLVLNGPAAVADFKPAPPVVEQPLDRRTFRVGSFNMHGGKGNDGTRDLARTAQCLQDLDLVGLYEVHASIGGSEPNQAAELGHRLEMAWLFAPTVRRWWHDGFGNGLLTRLPATNCLKIPLPGSTPKRARNVILFGFRHRDKTVRVLATHVDTRDDRKIQLQAVFDLFLALEEPAVLMGDFNTNASDPDLSQLLAQPGVRDAIADGLDNPPPAGRIDWLLTRGLRSVAAGYEPTPASDHPVIWAELEL
jgi:endonuclease/exonuclease/phosphatase family metal-dependent hydrolase